MRQLVCLLIAFLPGWMPLMLLAQTPESESPQPPAEAPASPGEPTTEAGYWERLRQAYEDFVEENKDKPREAKEWAEEDFARIGDWDYHIEAVALTEVDALQTRMNELGAERWEIFWVQAQGEQLLLFCKKPAVSYISRIPAQDLIRLLSAFGQKGLTPTEAPAP